MQFANGVRINRRADHVALTFTYSSPDEEFEGHANPDQQEAAESTVAEVVMPVTTAVGLALDLFDSMIQSVVELNKFFAGIQKRVAQLNEVSAKAQMDMTEKKES